jgi:hypothetical protein
MVYILAAGNKQSRGSPPNMDPFLTAAVSSVCDILKPVKMHNWIGRYLFNKIKLHNVIYTEEYWKENKFEAIRGSY